MITSGFDEDTLNRLCTVKPKDGVTFQWNITNIPVDSEATIEHRLANGWSFTRPEDQPHLPSENGRIQCAEFVLMEKPTSEIEQPQRESASKVLDAVFGFFSRLCPDGIEPMILPQRTDEERKRDKVRRMSE